MVTVALIILGLCAGSFVNALVWRLHQQEKLTAKSRKPKAKKLSPQPSALSPSDLSILKGRSMCPNCHHTLAWHDLLPVVSWLGLHGKCHYCHKPISIQYPAVEVLTALLFVLSYLFWPSTPSLQTSALSSPPFALFGFWLVFLVALVALAVYDLKWFLLPNKIVYPLIVLATVVGLIDVAQSGNILNSIFYLLTSFLIGSGIFYLIFQISNGKWIGGGDVKLGMLLGLILADPALTALMIFLASLLGSAVTLPLLALKKVKKDTHIPFGPFLIAGTIIARLFGAALIAWYKRLLIS